MLIKRSATEDEVVLEFLKGELKSERFGSKILEVLKSLSTSIDIIEKGNINLASENKIRKDILKKFRGYPDEGLFNNFPKCINWKYVEFDLVEDINNIFYINYDYWNDLSKGTSQPLKAAENIKEGTMVYGVSNKPFWDGLKYLESEKFDPIILLTYDGKKQLIIEGHSRMTTYGLDPKKFLDTYGYIGFCSYDEMKKYDPRIVDDKKY